VTMMAARKAIVEVLRGEGVEYVFGIPGATEILFVDALEGQPLLIQAGRGLSKSL